MDKEPKFVLAPYLEKRRGADSVKAVLRRALALRYNHLRRS